MVTVRKLIRIIILINCHNISNIRPNRNGVRVHRVYTSTGGFLVQRGFLRCYHNGHTDCYSHMCDLNIRFDLSIRFPPLLLTSTHDHDRQHYDRYYDYDCYACTRRDSDRRTSIRLCVCIWGGCMVTGLELGAVTVRLQCDQSS